MKVALPWKGRLVATFAFGVLRVLAFIGVGVLSALVVLALKNGQSYSPWLWALAVVAPLSGVLHWLESWIAHDMEIGRASCRGRVCQYVEILGVAVSLKKKK